jgi:hypothetical protein
VRGSQKDGTGVLIGQGTLLRGREGQLRVRGTNTVRTRLRVTTGIHREQKGDMDLIGVARNLFVGGVRVSQIRTVKMSFWWVFEFGKVGFGGF